MEKMWSPWRSAYIDSFSNKKDEHCIFCNVDENNINDDDSLVIFVSELSFVVLNLYPYNNGHLMVVPKRHLNDFSLMSFEERTDVMRLIDLSITALKKTCNPHGFNIGANIGKAAGAGIDDHLHFHIVPRWNGDTNFMPVLGEVKVISKELLQTKKELINAFKEII
ncbi:MAG: HIT domain-containing protein [Ignavibacteriales bacterium]